jgi:hypothetical protein
MVFDRPGDEDDALLQETRIDVVGALAPVGLLDHHRHKRVQIDVGWILHLCPGVGAQALANLVSLQSYYIWGGGPKRKREEG